MSVIIVMVVNSVLNGRRVVVNTALVSEVVNVFQFSEMKKKRKQWNSIDHEDDISASYSSKLPCLQPLP